MKRLTCWRSAVLSIVTVLTLPVYAQAADYSFTTEAPDDYYPSTSYEDVHGARYNYGGNNVIDYQIPELEYPDGGYHQFQSRILGNRQAGFADRQAT